MWYIFTHNYSLDVIIYFDSFSHQPTIFHNHKLFSFFVILRKQQQQLPENGVKIYIFIFILSLRFGKQNLISFWLFWFLLGYCSITLWKSSVTSIKKNFCDIKPGVMNDFDWVFWCSHLIYQAFQQHRDNKKNSNRTKCNKKIYL